jgi:hypothetical protein
MQSGKAKPYRSYVLRCWQEQEAASDRPPVWRFVLQEISGKQRRLGFGSFEHMMGFLLDELTAISLHRAEGEE